MKIKGLLLLASVMFAMAVFAQKSGLTAHFGDVKNAYNYWLYTPEQQMETVNETTPGDSVGVTVTRPKRKPVIIFLHGASLCGNSLERVRRYGTIDAIDKGREIDAYVIAPQNPGGAWQPQRIMNILQHVENTQPIDTARVYVVGMSLGGYGTIDFVAKYPDKVAAAMAFCGGGTSPDYEALNQVPLWVVHGTADRAVSVSQSDKIVSQMKAKGGASRLIYNRVPGWTHGTPAKLFYLSESYDWLMQHSLNDDNREVATNSIIGSNLIAHAYDGLSRSNPNVKGKYSRSKKSYSRSTRKKSKGKKRSSSRRKKRR